MKPQTYQQSIPNSYSGGPTYQGHRSAYSHQSQVQSRTEEQTDQYSPEKSNQSAYIGERQLSNQDYMISPMQTGLSQTNTVQNYGGAGVGSYELPLNYGGTRVNNIYHEENSVINPLQTQDDSRVFQYNQALRPNTIMSQKNRSGNRNDQYNLSPSLSNLNLVGSNQNDLSQQNIYSSAISQKTPNRNKSSSKKKKSNLNRSSRSNSGNKSKQTIGRNNYGCLIASPYSPESLMTRGPQQVENIMHQVPGIDDAQSELYRDYDRCGRTQNAFMQRAALAGIKNLHTASFKTSSPMQMVQSRFPEKYVRQSMTMTQNFDNPDVQIVNDDQYNHGDRDLSSVQVIQNMFPTITSNNPYQTQTEDDRNEQIEDNQRQNTLNTGDFAFLIEAGFQAVSETIFQTLGSFEQWQTLSVEDKLLQFASFLSNMRKDLRLGGLVGVYLLMRNNLHLVGEEIKRVIIEEIFTTLSEYETQEDVYLLAGLEVIGFIGPNERSLSRISIIKGLLCEPSLKRLQLASFCTLIQLGFEGFQAIVELASKDYNSLQSFLLENLLQLTAIQRIILVPSILTQLNMSESVKKQECVALLNRMGSLVWESGGLPILLDLLEEGTLDRQLVASVLRTSGEEGEDLLLKILRYHKDYKVRMASASVLPYRLPSNSRHLEVSLRLDSNDVVQLDAIPPGQICRYYGPISSLVQDELNKSETEMALKELPYVEINSRDFLASLQRMIAMCSEYFVQQFENDEERNNIVQLQTCRFLVKFDSRHVQSILLNDPTFAFNPYIYGGQAFQNQNQGLRKPISDNIVKTLSTQLMKEEKAQVREVIAAAIGTIGLPEGEQCVENLIKCLSNADQDPNVKAMCVWSLGRLATHQTGQKSKKILVAALKDSYWKVRAAACTAVAQIGEPVAHVTIPILTKLLRDGQVNRQTVAETMINVGTLGEQTLVQILKNEPENNHKLRECIVRALALSNVNNPNIDFVIEVLFQTSKDKNPLVRKSSLLSLDILHKKQAVNDTVTYLKARHLLPFFYRCLNDKDKQVRNCALLCIQNFGPQGELMFIEGLTKDKNFAIRCECANGLAQIGPSTFRTLLLSLHDPHPSVRDAASLAILKNMSCERVDEAFKGKEHQRQTIKCAIREVLSNNLILMNEIKSYMSRLMEIFELGSLSNLNFYPNENLRTGNYKQQQQQQPQVQYNQSSRQNQANNKENTYHQVRKASAQNSQSKVNSFSLQGNSSMTKPLQGQYNQSLVKDDRSRQQDRQQLGAFHNQTENYSNNLANQMLL